MAVIYNSLASWVGLGAAPKPQDTSVEVMERLAENYPISAMRPAIEVKKLPSEHPLSHKVVDYVQGKNPPTRKSLSEDLPVCSEKVQVDLSQGGQSIDDFIALVKAKGDSLTSIEVTNANDDLFVAIGTSCTNLTTFVFNEIPNSNSVGLTGVGLQSVAQLPKLTTLYFQGITATVTEQDLEAFFASPIMSANLLHLNFGDNVFWDSTYIAISKYSKLQTLSLSGSLIVSAATLEKYSLPLSLTKFILNQMTKGIITDAFLISLPVGLTELTVKGNWKEVTPSSFFAAIKRLPLITKLGLHGTIRPYMIYALTTPLSSLQLGDCSELQTSDFENLLTLQPNLLELTIGKGINFTQDLSLPNLESLYLEAPKLNSLSALPRSLKRLTLVNIKVNYLGFKPLAYLHHLEFLEIENCKYFNTGSLRPIIANIKDKLRHIRLSWAAVDEAGLTLLGLCSRLETIILVNCLGIDSEGIKLFLSNAAIANGTKNLFLQGFNLTNEMAPLLTPFENLKIFYFGNCDIKTMWPEDFLKNPTLVKNHTILYTWWGGGPSFVPIFKREIQG